MIEDSVKLGYIVDITSLISGNLKWLKYSDFYITKIALDELKKINNTSDINDIRVILEDIVDIIRIQRNIYEKFLLTQNAKIKINPRINLDGNRIREYTVTMAFEDNKFNIIINKII
ncbi:MAG: hypothetical protein ACRC5S_03665 [Cetobacterium sp.]|uniref:hypothetical protein n=1 Tax=Cetobacterium somerae TaxID=188913 RepID=UPI002E7B9AA5|nr:hypothetical protein [Cetobacterium somerae]WVJ03098.1 hypothetical protein VSU16_15310 [Cetobacterium somerae]